MQMLLVLVVIGGDDSDMDLGSTRAVLVRVFVQNSAFSAQLTLPPSLFLALW